MIAADVARAAEDASRRDRPALIHGSTVLTYAQLWRGIDRARRWFAAHLPTGARVVLLLEGSPELVVALHAATAAGLIAVPIDDAIHPRNLDHVLADSEPAAVVATGRALASIAACPAAGQLRPLLVGVDRRPAVDAGGGVAEWDELVAGERGPAPPPPAEERPAVISYTTGTTGLRKGAVLSHRALSAATRNINAFTRLAPGSVELVCMPITHSFGFARLRCALAVGGTAVLAPGMRRPGDLLDAASDHQVTSIGLVPMACRMLMDHYRARLASIGPQLRLLELGSDVLDRRHKEELLDLLPNARICMHYGLTEASRSTFLELRSERAHLDTIGRPSPGVEVAVLDGEICVRADTVMLEYWRKPELTAETLRGGWLHTGDLGAVDGDGYLRLLGRRSDVFKVAGFSVAPAEIEAVLASHPAVAEAAVTVAASTQSAAIALTAFVVPAGAPPDLGELRRHCRLQLEAYKVPTRFILVAALPRTPSGKLRRSELSQLLEHPV